MIAARRLQDAGERCVIEAAVVVTMIDVLMVYSTLHPIIAHNLTYLRQDLGPRCLAHTTAGQLRDQILIRRKETVHKDPLLMTGPKTLLRCQGKVDSTSNPTIDSAPTVQLPVHASCKFQVRNDSVNNI
jgi:hypothetical protein